MTPWGGRVFVFTILFGFHIYSKLFGGLFLTVFATCSEHFATFPRPFCLTIFAAWLGSSSGFSPLFFQMIYATFLGFLTGFAICWRLCYDNIRVVPGTLFSPFSLLVLTISATDRDLLLTISAACLGLSLIHFFIFQTILTFFPGVVSLKFRNYFGTLLYVSRVVGDSPPDNSLDFFWTLDHFGDFWESS